MGEPAYMKNAVPEQPAAPSYMKNAVPDDRVDPAVVAHAAADQTHPQAAKTLDIADKTGMAPQYIARDFDGASRAHDKQTFADQLRYSPVLSAWAAQSPQHAALVKPDAEALGETEGWLSGMGDALKAGLRDIAGAEAMRERMGGGGPFADQAFQLEEEGRQYDSREHSFPQQVVRAAPQMFLYAAAEYLTGRVGLSGLLYAQNKGVLARQIQLAQPKDTREWQSERLPNGDLRVFKVGPEPDRLTPEEIDKYATAGSAAASVTLAGLLTPLLRSMPGVKPALQSIAASTLSRAAATTLGQVAIRGLKAWGDHTLMGALGMTLQHSINDATAQKATTGDVDLLQVGRDSANNFLKVLPLAATFAAYSPARDALAERGRLNGAPAERAKLDAMIGQAKKMQMAKTAPERLADLFGEMGRGVKVFIDHAAAKKMTGLNPADVAAAEVGKDAVAVPVGDYLTKFADQHEAVKDDVKLSADGATMNEARERDKELRKALPPDMAEILLGKATPDEVLQFGQPEQKSTEAPPAAAKEGKVSETVKLYRGTNSGRDPSQPGLAGARFLSPDRAVAESYANRLPTMRAAMRDPETGKIYTGQSHVEAYNSAPLEVQARFSEPYHGFTDDATQGFVDSENKFYTRSEASKELAENPRYKAGTGGKVSAETMNFQNVLKVESREALREKLGFKADPDEIHTADDELGNLEAILNKAREQGYDAVSYKSVKGTEYVDLMNWLHEMVKQYGGTVAKWQEKLTPEFIAALKEEGSKGAISAEEHAARLVEAMQVQDIDPARFERLAKMSSKYIQEAAEKARSGSAAGAKAYSPADVAVLQTHEMARDVNLAKAERATEVKAEMNNISETFTKSAGNEKLRGLLRQAGTPLLDLFDAITRRSPGDPTLLVDVKDWFKDAARPFPANEQVVQKYLSNPRWFGELYPAEARVLADFVKTLSSTARDESVVRSKDAEAAVAEVAAEIRVELRQNPSKGLLPPSGAPDPSFWQKRLLDANAANAVLSRPKNAMRQKSTAMAKWIFGVINDAMYVRDRLFREAGDPVRAAYDAMPKDVAKRGLETYDLSDKLPSPPGIGPMVVSRKWIWKLGQHWGSAGNIERVTSATGWDPATLSGILFDDPKTKLSIPEWDAIQAISDMHEQHVWPKMKAHYEENYPGARLPKTAAVPFKVQLEDGTSKDYAGGYSPLKRDARPGAAPQPEPANGVAQYWGGDFQVPWVPSMAKERVDNSHYLVNMDFDSGRAALAQALHWLAFDRPTRDVAKLLNDPGLASDMNEFMGPHKADMIRGWLKTSATRQFGSTPEGQEVVGRALGWQRGIQMVQIIGGSVRMGVQAALHAPNLMFGGRVNPIYGTPAFLSIFKPMTLANGEVRLFPNWNDAITHGEEVQHRAENAYGYLRKSWYQAPAANPLSALLAVAKGTAGLYLHAADRLTTTWAWTAFHNEAVGRFGMEPFSDEAKAYANGKTQDVMPVHDIETAAPLLTNRQVGAFLIMHGFKNTLYQFRQDDLAASVRDFHLADSPKEYGGAIAKTAGRLGLQLAMYGGFSVVGGLATGHGQEEGESKGQWLARRFMAGQTHDIPFIGALGEPMAKYITGQDVTKRDIAMAFPDFPGMAALNKLEEMLGKLVNGGREDYKKVFDMLEGALFFSGTPSKPTRAGAEKLYELLMGEGYDDVEASTFDRVGHLFYTDKQWESIKRSLTPDED